MHTTTPTTQRVYWLLKRIGEGCLTKGEHLGKIGNTDAVIRDHIHHRYLTEDDLVAKINSKPKEIKEAILNLLHQGLIEEINLYRQESQAGPVWKGIAYQCIYN